MSKLLTCPQGHQWELSETGEGSTTDLRVLCPICGAAVDLSHSIPSEEAPTGAYMTGSNVETLPPPAAQPELGEPLVEGPAPPAIPGYEILGELGRGGMGRVYRARQSKLDRLVALKILPPETSRDSNFTERFNREARALARLNHANIITVYDFGQAEGLSYLVMEYVDGANLRQLMKAGLVSPQQTLQIMSQICDALQYAHDEGIVHRDIKPENILRDKRGRVKIADFGIAKLLARTTKDFTLTGPWQVLGTFHYMAPEQIENPGSLDHRADIYSLGVMFYEMLTGGLPIGRFALPSQKANIDSRIDEVVLKALEKEPERRYQHVSELKVAIDELLGQLGSGIQPETGPRLPAMPNLAVARTSDPTTVRTPEQVEVSKDNLRQRLDSFLAEPFAEFKRLLSPAADILRIGQLVHASRLKALGLGLMVTGCVDCLFWILYWVLGAYSRSFLETYFVKVQLADPRSALLPAATIIGLLQGIVVIIGARRIRQLQAYRFVVFSSFVAMIPCSPTFLIGLPMGIWALMMLRNPEVKAAFGATQWAETAESRPVTGPHSAARPSLPGERTSDLTTAQVPQSVEVSKDNVRRRLKGLALGLMVTGWAALILGLLGLSLVAWAVIVIGPRDVSDVANWMFIAAIIGLLQGSVVIIGARQIRKLEAYQFAIFSTLVAMLPCSPAFLIGLPIGLWAFIALLSQEVRATFHGGYFQPKPITSSVRKGRFRRLFGTTTGWAMILSFLGCLRTFLPWADLQVPMSNSVFNVLASVNGYETVFGIMTALIFLVLLLVLVATGFIEPMPGWRPAMLFVAGVGCIMLPIMSAGRLSVSEPMSSAGHATLEGRGFSLGVSLDATKGGIVCRAAGGDERATYTTWDQVISQTRVALQEGAYMAIALGFGFLLLGALQLRSILMKTSQES